MARKKRGLHLLIGVAVGFFVGYAMRVDRNSCSKSNRIGAGDYKAPDPVKLINLRKDESIHNSNKTLVFVGVMTAEPYLATRAKAVYETWGMEMPGRVVFFSSETSRSPDIPLVPLKNVDDSYPPQKKSFMMLLYMYEHYGDKFEWFFRADDDVYVRGDKLELFLRSVDSRKAQFIGQAGRGTRDEFGALALNYDENFCMGGPGVLLSRETLRRVAPHVKYCLKNLYTSHEDVELGRCVQKFAGVPCTWSYDMQMILHHNSSGDRAYVGPLKRREVHRAITLHPLKDYRQMYRLYSYFKNLRAQDIREQTLSLHRDIVAAGEALGLAPEQLMYASIFDGVPLFPIKQGEDGYLGDASILGVTPSLNRFKPVKLEDILKWDFISKAVYGHTNANPKRKLEVYVKEGLDDVIREVMEQLNAVSRQRGRVIEFFGLLYGYTRLDPLHGADTILDLLLNYRRYRGRKMTTAVRRHAYLQQSFTGIEIRELPLGQRPLHDNVTLVDKQIKSPGDYAEGENVYPSGEYEMTNQLQTSFINIKRLNIPIKEAFENGLMRISETLPKVFSSGANKNAFNKFKEKVVKFILPLSGRYDTFARFMLNYEEVCLKSDERATLVVVLHTADDYEKSVKLVDFYKTKYVNKDIKYVEVSGEYFSRGRFIDEGAAICDNDDLLFFIDVDMMFNFDTLRKIRLHTIKNYQVYFPIVFSMFKPEVVSGDDFNSLNVHFTDSYLVNAVPKQFRDYNNNLVDKLSDETDRDFINTKYTKEINDDGGYFRQFGYGIASMYKSDLRLIGGFRNDIKGWGLEDVNLYEKFVFSNITIYRSADPSLVHVYHKVDCDPTLGSSQLTMCVGSKASVHGSLKQMTYYTLNHWKIIWPEKDNR